MSATYEIGDVVTSRFTLTVSGAPTDATVNLVVTAPDGTTVAAIVSHPGLGVYDGTWTATQNGLHLLRWVATGAVTAAQTETVYVGGLASIDDLKAHTNLRTSGSTTDAELQRFLDAATYVVENIAGPILPRTITSEVHDGGDGTRILLTLRERPLITVTSVTEYGVGTATVLAQVANPAASTTNSYTVEPLTGIITRRTSGGGVACFPSGVGNVLVTYIAGYSVIPSNVRLAALFQAAHMFQSSQLGGRRALSTAASADDTYTWAAGYGIPNRVRELLQPHQRLPGIA